MAMYYDVTPPVGYMAGTHPAPGPGYGQPVDGQPGYAPQHMGYGMHPAAPPPAPPMQYFGAPPWPQWPHTQLAAPPYQQQPMMASQAQHSHMQPQYGHYPASQAMSYPQQGVPYQQLVGMQPVPPPPGQHGHITAGQSGSIPSSRGSSHAGGQMGLNVGQPHGGVQQDAQHPGGQINSPAPDGPQQQQQQQQGASAGKPYTPPIDPAAAPSHDAGTWQDGSAASTPISTSSRGGNSGSVLLAALQNTSRENAAAGGSSGSSAAAQVSSGAGGGSSSSSAAVAGRIDYKGIYLQGIPPNTTKEELEAMFAAYGKVVNVMIIGVKWHATKCAFVNYADAAAAQKALAVKTVMVGDTAVVVKPKVTKGKADAAAASSSAGASLSAAGNPAGNKQQSRWLGQNELGLPMVRGAACCPFFMGTAACTFKSGCRYHHPMHAMHPECVLQGKKPHRYDLGLSPSYARLVNFTERLWDYDSCAEAQLKIWLARHLLASENSGCGMFDESAAVPAAEEYAAFTDEAQPLGPYSCTVDEADQVLQLLWKAQPDDAAKQAMPYKGKLQQLLGDEPHYQLAPDPISGRMWVQLQVGSIKRLLNF